MTAAPFDKQGTHFFNEARRSFLDSFIPEMIRQCGVETALDLGCGIDYFSKYLADLRLRVTALDGRPENLTEIGKRNLDVECWVVDVEELNSQYWSQFDIVFCFGLPYHLVDALRHRSFRSRAGHVPDALRPSEGRGWVGASAGEE